MTEEVPESLTKIFPDKNLPFPRELIEDIGEEHLDFLAEVFQLEDHRRYTNWSVTFLCINGDFLQRGGDYKVASRMIKEMGRWVAKGIPQQPLFLMLANAYYNDQCIGRTGETIKKEMVDFDREQRERYKSAGGDISFISRRISELGLPPKTPSANAASTSPPTSYAQRWTTTPATPWSDC